MLQKWKNSATINGCYEGLKKSFLESERTKIDLVNFFHGKNECAVDVLWHCYFHVIHVVLVIILVGNKYLGVELWKA